MAIINGTNASEYIPGTGNRDIIFGNGGNDTLRGFGGDDDLYGGTFRLFERVRRRSANLDFTFIDMSDASAVEKAMRPNTRMVWVETPSRAR